MIIFAGKFVEKWELSGEVRTMRDGKAYSQLIGRRLRHFRTAQGLSQEQVAFDSGLNTNSVGMIERGIKSPTLSTLKRICDSLGITLAELFLYSEDGGGADNSEAIQRVTVLMHDLTPDDARRVAAIVEQAVAMRQN